VKAGSLPETLNGKSQVSMSVWVLGDLGVSCRERLQPWLFEKDSEAEQRKLKAIFLFD